MLKYAIEEIQTQFYKEFESNRKSEKLFERICTAINRNIFIHRWHPQMFAMQRVEKVSQKIGNIDIQKEISKVRQIPVLKSTSKFTGIYGCSKVK